MAIVEISITEAAINAAISGAGKAAGSGLDAANAVERDYFKNFGTRLGDDLNAKFGKDSTAAKRARLFLSGKFTAKERIRVAVEGAGTDWPEIWAALQESPASEMVTLRDEWELKKEIYELINGEWTCTKYDRDRIGSIFRARAPKEGEKVDFQDMLNARGVVAGDQDAVLKLVLEEPAIEKAFQEAFKTTGFREQFLASSRNPRHLENAETLQTGTWIKKVKVAADLKSLPGLRRLFLVGQITDDERKQIRENEGLIGKLRAVDGFGELEPQLAPTDPLERAKWLKASVAGEALGERGSGPGAALGDELRELDVAVSAVKDPKNLTPEERARLEFREGKAEAALGVYAQWRDEMNAIAIQALTVTAGILISFATAGAGAAVGIEMISAQFAAQVGRAALANAIASVAVQYMVKGDRLDADAAKAAFVSGAVRGRPSWWPRQRRVR